MASKAKVKKPAPARKKAANAYKLPEPIPVGEVLEDMAKKKWRIGPSIGCGGFGAIYSACEHDAKKSSSYPYVIKIEPHGNGPLFVEMHFYMRNAKKEDIDDFKKKHKLISLGMPMFFGKGSHEYKGEKYRFLVLERFGTDLWKLFEKNNKSFPVHTVLRLGIQMLDVLEYIHEHSYVHADIKGANILLGYTKGTEQQAYLVDFGLATRCSEKEYKRDPKRAHDGTIEYTSRDAHMGVPTKRGDLEILAYNLVQWICGTLPWMNVLATPTKVQAEKDKYMDNIPQFINKCFTKDPAPEAIVSFLKYISSLKHNDDPDYKKCRQLFESGLKKLGYAVSCNLDFTQTAATKPNRKTKRSIEPIKDEINSDDEVQSNVDEENSPPKKVASKAAKPKLLVKKNTIKRKSVEPIIGDNAEVKKIAKTERVSTPRTRVSTPRVKAVNTIGTQTSLEKVKRQSNPNLKNINASTDEIVSTRTLRKKYIEESNTSTDMFDDSVVSSPEQKLPLVKNVRKKPTAVLCETTDEEIVSEKIVRRKVQVPKRSWRDCATIVNGKKAKV